MNIENYIKTQSQEADKLAKRWFVFVSQHPDVSHFVLKQEFVAWANTHGNINTDIWVGKEIQDAYFYLRQQHEEKQIKQTGHVDNHNVPDVLAALGFLGGLFSREHPKILEEDPHFKRILNEKANAWLKDHPEKDTSSKEWIDYRYGSLENPSAPTLFSNTEEEFKTKHETLWKQYSEERKKVYDDPRQDPTFIWHQEEIELHTQVRHELLTKQNPGITVEQIKKQVETAHWERFAEQHPEKATAYTTKHEEIKVAVARVEERVVLQPSPKPPQPILQQQSLIISPPIPRISSPTNSRGIPPNPLSIRRPPIPGGGIGNAIRNGLSGNPLTNLAKNAAIQSAAAVIIPILIISVITFAIVFGVIGGEATTLEASPNEAGGSSNVTSCQFTKSNSLRPIKSSILQGWITDAANKAGIPSSVLASVAMHENQSFAANKTDTDIEIKDNSFCNRGETFCVINANRVERKNGEDPKCTDDEKKIGGKDATAIGLMQLLDIYHEGENLCSITENLDIAAQKLKTDGLTQSPTKDEITNVITSYFTRCEYGSFNYCDEVWKDFQNCQQKQPALTAQLPVTGDAKNILDWTSKINDVLEEGPIGDFNKMTANITNGSYTATTRTGEFINTSPRGLYWCTNLVIDAFNLAGKTGLGLDHQAVISMRNFWKSTPGYTHLDYLNDDHKNILSTITPGFTIFSESQPGIFTGNEHVAIIKFKSIDPRGNGFLETYDANTNAKIQLYPIVDWEVKNQRYTLVGFGTIK
ncbi:MAG: hypothetical protein HYV37_00190 [Candidatus Levyibacteriota bacterium]|nr:MAG: hypothetical protein HYV37_00190 [Candidatus Levybacteria bacterium]